MINLIFLNVSFLIYSSPHLIGYLFSHEFSRLFSHIPLSGVFKNKVEHLNENIKSSFILFE